MIGKKEQILITNIDWNPKSWASEHIGTVFSGVRTKYVGGYIQDDAEWWYAVSPYGFVHPSMCRVLCMEPKRDIKRHEF